MNSGSKTVASWNAEFLGFETKKKSKLRGKSNRSRCYEWMVEKTNVAFVWAPLLFRKNTYQDLKENMNEDWLLEKSTNLRETNDAKNNRKLLVF